MRDRFRNPHSETCTERSRSIRNRTTILNVDDDEASRYAVSRILRQAGFEVMEAANGAEALRLVKENPDLIILDVNLPDMSGFEVCWRIKADPATALIPVLHLTATYRDSQSMVMGLDGGADGYLTHPVEPPVLVSTVKAFLRIRQAEAELQAAAREWRTTFDAIGDAVCLLDLEGRILRCNEAMTNLLGKPFDKIIGRTCWELVHGTSEPIAGCPVVRMRESRRRESLVLPMGGRWLEVVVDPLLDEDDNLIGAVHIVSDITERKRAEEALWESEERLRRLFDTMSEGVVLIAPDGQITQANPAAERILGLQRSEIESRNYVGPEWEILRPDGTPMPPDEMAGPRAMKEKRLMENVVMGVRWPDGSISWINVNAAPLITESGEFEGVVGTFADITERKRAEEELQRSLETLRRTLEGTVNVLVSAIELRDPYTAGHQRGVTQLACAIANELGLSEE
ncbi:MAG: PAS domain S-box protein, partial [Chloroflexi bacterium]|nr:PAS domain S-box protein [Chloroflexota bacterium]